MRQIYSITNNICEENLYDIVYIYVYLVTKITLTETITTEISD